MNLNIYRGSTAWVTIKTDDETRLIRQLLGEDIIKSSFNSHIFLDIGIGDFIVYDGVIYHINSLPNVKKNSINSYDYDITFESESYELLKTQFLDLDGNSDFYLVGNLETFIDLIVTNMGREHTGWVKGTCDQTNSDYKLLSFSKNNCMQVLQKLCSEFEGEFYFEFALDFTAGAELPYLPAADAVIGYKPAVEAEHDYHPVECSINSYTKDICFTDKAGSDSGLTFKYKQGLRNIHRNTLSEKNIITRLYAFGSTKNLASDYRDHSRRLIFVDGEVSYLEKNVDKYGTIEHTEIFNDIYPHREGTISSVDAEDVTKFFDSGMDFDLNDYLLSGVTAKLHFNTGNLGGYEFEVSVYNNSTKEFTIIAFKDDQGYEMPNATLKPAVGDKYVLLEIYLPQSYIDTAETALQAKAQTYLDDNCEPRVTYILTPDPRYFETHLVDLEVGDFVTIEDTDLGIDVMTRIVELTKSVADEYKYTLKLTDHLEVQLIQRIYDEQGDLKEKIEIGEGGDIIRSRRNWRTSEELRVMVFDTDGYFDMGNIKPESVSTSMLSVGAKSTQFILKEIEIEANYTSDVSKFHASAGSLIHLSIADEIRTWTLSENTQESLVNETAYYIYAKCTKEPGYTGQVVVDSVQRKFDDDETYYYFLIGVLHSVIDSVRGVSLTYGQTIINGKFIRTGKIESTDGNTYFDLDNNTLVIASGAGTIAGTNITSIEDGADVTADSTFVTVTYPADLTDLQDQIDGKIVSWFTDTDPSGTWGGTDASHEGDMWWNTSTKKLKRYTGIIWSADIEDQKAIDAYTDAATAQDTADGKRRVFTATPTTPYNVGDLWSAGPTGDLKKCKVERLTGAYVAADWELATNYDETATHTAADIINLPATPAGAGLYATGSYLGYYDGAAWKAYIQNNGNFYFNGDANNYIQWNGASLAIKGSITLVNTIPNAKVDGLGSFALISSLAYGSLTGTKPPENADVTLSAIQGELSLAGGGLVLASAGAKIRGGQTAYGVGTGFWLGDVGGVSKFSIGSSANWLKWSGTALSIKGRLSVGSGTDEDIYFDESGIRFYDYNSVLSNALIFAKSGLCSLFFNLTSIADVVGTIGGSRIEFYADDKAIINCVSNAFTFYPGGTLQLPKLSSAPTPHNGDIALNATQRLLRLYNTTDAGWYHADTSDAGW